MMKHLAVLYFATGFFWLTRGNPLLKLLSQIPNQNCNCPWNIQALLQPPQYGPYQTQNEVQNPTCPVQACETPSLDLNLNQLIYNKIFERLGGNRNFNLNNNMQCTPNVNNDNIQPHVYKDNMQTRVYNDNIQPHVVNNYIVVPPEAFQDSPQCNRKVCNEKRNRRQDDNTECVAKRNKNKDFEQAHEGNCEERQQSDKEPRRRRKRKRDPNRSDRDQKFTSRKNEKPKNGTAIINEVAVENVTKELSDNQNESNNSLIESQLTTNATKATTNTDSHETVTDDTKTVAKTNASNSTDIISEVKETTQNGTQSNNSKTGNRKRSRKRKPKKGKNKDIQTKNSRPANSKEDELIEDFREKFPNIPEDLIVKLIDYMKNKLQDDQSSISNAFNNYRNYPFNFDQFYNAQLTNMFPNPEITVNPRNNGGKTKRKRNRRRKSKKSNTSDCNTVVELSPTILGNGDNENDTLTLEKDKLIPENNSKNETLPDTTNVDSSNVRIKSYKSQHASSLAEDEVETVHEPNKINSTTFDATTVKKLNKEVNPNERIIKIKISVEPQENAVTELVDNDKSNIPNLKNELIVSNSNNKVLIDRNIKTAISTEESNDEEVENSEEISSKNKDAKTNDDDTKLTPVDEVKQEETQPSPEKQNENILSYPKLGEDIVQAVENEINDYFPNFKADNFAYLLHDDLDELTRIKEGRYYYTTEIQLEDSSENYKHVNIIPEELTIDLTPKTFKTYSEIEDTIQKPEVEINEEELEFRTPPTLEVPDFETKPIKKSDVTFFDHGDYKPEKYVENKVSAYSNHKNAFGNKPKSENNFYSSDIETVFAKSKVAKYGRKADEDDYLNSATPKTVDINSSEVNGYNNNNNNFTVVLAQSY